VGDGFGVGEGVTDALGVGEAFGVGDGTEVVSAVAVFSVPDVSPAITGRVDSIGRLTDFNAHEEKTIITINKFSINRYRAFLLISYLLKSFIIVAE